MVALMCAHYGGGERLRQPSAQEHLVPSLSKGTSKVPLGKSPTVEMTRRRVRRARSFRFGFISDWSEPVARLLENDPRIGRTLGACAEALFGHSVAGLVPDPCFEDVWRPRPL